MSTLLKINVSPRGVYSVSGRLASEFASQWQAAHPDGKVVTRDLARTDLPFVDLPWITGAYSTPDQHTPEQKAAIKVSDNLIDELFAATDIVMGTPMYNFSIPAALKAYIDHIVRINKTFGPGYVPLVTGKKMTVIIASSGVYTPGSPAESYNAEAAYIKQIFGFIGITDITVVLAGGTSAIDQGKVKREDFLAPFEQQVASLAGAR